MDDQPGMLEWTDEAIAKFWNYMSRFPETYFTYQHGDILALQFKRFLSNQQVLDYGCGAGFLISHLLKFGAEVTGTDFSPESLRLVNQKFSAQNNFRKALSVPELLEKNLQFDVIFCIEVLEHLNDLYLQKTIANLKQLLKPQGYLIITVPNDENLSDSYVFCPESNKIFHRWQHVRSWSQAQLTTVLSQAGFLIQDTYTTDLAVVFQKQPLRFFLHLIKRFILRRKMPHLICICRVAS